MQLSTQKREMLNELIRRNAVPANKQEIVNELVRRGELIGQSQAQPPSSPTPPSIQRPIPGQDVVATGTSEQLQNLERLSQPEVQQAAGVEQIDTGSIPGFIAEDIAGGIQRGIKAVPQVFNIAKGVFLGDEEATQRAAQIGREIEQSRQQTTTAPGVAGLAELVPATAAATLVPGGVNVR